jgi:tetratricopeptide (TPR) repeat protein
MDVNLSPAIARLGGALLALACCGPVVADDASTMQFVTDDASDGDVAYASSDDGADSMVQIIDDAPAGSAAAPVAIADARGDLTVVANGSQRGPVTAVVVDADVTPAAHNSGGLSWGSVFGSGPRRPSAAAGIQGSRQPQASSTPRRSAQRQAAAAPTPRIVDAPLAYDTDTAAPAAVTARRAATATAPQKASAVARIKSPEDHAKQLLVNAHQLSLSAQNEAQYSQIVQWCAAAMRSNVDAESKQFGATLSAWALNRRGQARADQGEIELALADFHTALEYDPANYRALHNRAVTFAQNGQFAEAFDDVSRVIQLKPDFAKAYSNRATLYVQAGEFEKALADYDAALAADPNLLQALVGRGRVCHIRGELTDALTSFDAAIELEPNDAEIICSRADLLADLGRYEDALAGYAAAIDLNSKFEHAYRNGAWLLATCPEDSVRDVEGALAGAQAALECGYGERHAALDTMAAALANAGRYEEAVGTLQQAVEVAPEGARAAYEARLQLYESKQPFRTHPVGAATASAAVQQTVPATGDVTDGAEEVVFIEE